MGVVCPECKADIAHLHHIRQTRQETEFFIGSQGKVLDGPAFPYMETGLEAQTFCCPECGEQLTDDDVVAEAIMRGQPVVKMAGSWAIS